MASTTQNPEGRKRKPTKIDVLKLKYLIHWKFPQAHVQYLFTYVAPLILFFFKVFFVVDHF